MFKLVISILFFIAILWLVAALGSVILYISAVILTVASIIGLIRFLLTAKDNTGI